MKLTKSGEIVNRVRTWLVERAWVRIVVDKDKLDDTLLFALNNVIFNEFNKRSLGRWKIEYIGAKTEIEGDP